MLKNAIGNLLFVTNLSIIYLINTFFLYKVLNLTKQYILQEIVP